uniref:E3 ubiquitin-protein ligase NEURL1B n=1 Tax=Aegilops tauschii TaxID=37682 RepID=M8C3L3_AEGTA
MAAAATSCFVVVLALCLLVSMALMAGHYYGRAELVAGPGCSRLVRANPLFVQDITVRAAEEEGSGASGLVLYGLAEIPGLLDDVPAVWSEARRVVLPANSHKEWVYFLNSGSQIEVNCSVEPGTGLTNPLRITIAQGDAGFQDQRRALQHERSRVRVLAVAGQLRLHVPAAGPGGERGRPVVRPETGVDKPLNPLNIQLRYMHCSVLLRLDSDDGQGVKVELSYGPRWIVYFVGSAILAVSLLLLYEVLSVLLGFCCAVVADQRTTTATTTASLLECKEEEEGGSRGSSFESVSSHDGEAGDEEEGRRLCVVCCDARRDCFFMPCGHSATCHACGTKIVEGDASCCPFCRRKLKKVRRIFCV